MTRSGSPAHCRPKRIAALLVLLLCASPLACGMFGGDGDQATPEEATAIELGKPASNELVCDEDRDGDCDDWWRLSVPKGGPLVVTVSMLAGAGARTKMILAITDATSVPIQEAKSGGKSRIEVTKEVKPGEYLVWVGIDGKDGGEATYRLEAVVDAQKAVEAAASDPEAEARACFALRASPRLNFFDGQPHVVRLSLLPLESRTGFDQSDEVGLISGEPPNGAMGKPITMRIAPGEERRVNETLPKGARFIGIVADYYRAPGGEAGRRKLVIPVACSGGGNVVGLLETELGGE